MDPLSLGAIGGAALTEGVRFLYAQATEILKRRRDRSDEFEVAPEIEILDGRLEPLTIDPSALGRLEGDLRVLRSALGDYVDGIDEVDTGDRSLLATVDGLRRVLEAIYGQRITFKGEERPATGSVVEGAVDVEQVVGLVAGVRARYITGGHVTGTVRANRVEGQAFGVDVDSVGD